jgi:integrase
MRERKSIGLREVRALKPNEMVLDAKVAGFAARRQKGASVVYVIRYRTKEGRERWHTIGRHGAPWTPDEARKEAQRILGEVVKGADPAALKAQARQAPTVAELCEDYLKAAEAGRILTRLRAAKKPSTLATDTGRIVRHIKPLIGALKVASVTRTDIERFRDAVSEGKTKARIKTGKHGLANVRGGRGTATRTMGLLGAIFAFAARRGLRADNPVHSVERYADGHRARRLSEAEYGALGHTLRTMGESTTWPPSLALARFLAITGWRRGEALALTWGEVDLATGTARLSDTKTGASMRPLSNSACDLLRALPRLGELVFPASIGADKPMSGFHKTWLRVAKSAAFGVDVTPHILRHSFASIAADLGFSELTIAALLGHKKASVTSKYAHHADAVLLQAADAVSNRIAELMGDREQDGAIVPFKRG